MVIGNYATVRGALLTLLEAHRNLRKARAVRPLERSLEKGAAAFFKAEGAEFLKRLATLATRFPGTEGAVLVMMRDWSPLLDEASGVTAETLLNAWEAAAGAALVKGGNHLFASLGADLVFTLEHPRVSAYLAQNAAVLVTKVDDTTRAALNRLITAGQEAGWSYDRIAREIRRQFAEFAAGRPQQHIASRAHLVAVTEVGEAYEASAFMGAQEMASLGLMMVKRWVTVGDERVSEGCRRNEADGWIGLEQAHSSGHMKPLRFPGCRCDEQYDVRAA
jgi:hypothetical protein